MDSDRNTSELITPEELSKFIKIIDSEDTGLLVPYDIEQFAEMTNLKTYLPKLQSLVNSHELQDSTQLTENDQKILFL